MSLQPLIPEGRLYFTQRENVVTCDRTELSPAII